MKTIWEEFNTLKTRKQLLNVENKSIITDGLSGHNKTYFTFDFMTLVSEKDILAYLAYFGKLSVSLSCCSFCLS